MSPIRILIADDDRDFADSLAELLLLDGHEATAVYSGAEAIAAFGQRRFDAAVIDMRMPGCDGIDTLARLRALSPQACLLMMSGYRVEQMLREATDGGAVTILPDDAGPEDVVRALERDLALAVHRDPAFPERALRTIAARAPAAALIRSDGEARALAPGAAGAVILDLGVPIVRSLETCRGLRRRGVAVPVLLIARPVAAEDPGADPLRSPAVTGCVLKPFDLADLFGALRVLTPCAPD